MPTETPTRVMTTQETCPECEGLNPPSAVMATRWKLEEQDGSLMQRRTVRFSCVYCGCVKTITQQREVGNR